MSAGPVTARVVSENDIATRQVSHSGPVAELPAGTLVGPYVVVERAGSGSMGTVYHAYDPRLNRRVALKVLRQEGVSAWVKGEQRLVREAQALAQLSSANVVQVYEVATADVVERGEVLFVAMEFADGETLSDWWSRVTPSWREIVSVVSAAGQGLADAHAVGLIHRDFKPANVLVAADGRARVVDFGLAKLSESNAGEVPPPVGLLRETDGAPVVLEAGTGPLTEHGTVLGTPAYMAPEQLDGQMGDERSDQYALCVTLYEGLYGTRPFASTGETPLSSAEQKQSMLLTPLTPVARRRRVPARLRQIVLRGLAPEPGDRWVSIAALLAALESFQGRRRRIALVTAGSAVVGLLAMPAVVGDHDDPCEAVGAPIGTVWTDARRLRLRSDFEATKIAVADVTGARVAGKLESFASAWRAGRRDVCESQAHAEQSTVLLASRTACLDDALRGMEGLLEAFTDPGGDLVVHADAAVAQLPSISRCSDIDAMLADAALPHDPETARSVERVRRKIAKTKALATAGNREQTLERAAAVAHRAREIDYKPLIAEALLELGKAQLSRGQTAQAELSLEEAIRLAIVSRQDSVALEAVRVLLHLMSLSRDEPKAALALRSVLEGLLARLSPLAIQRVRPLVTLGAALAKVRRYDDALPVITEAIEIGRIHIGTNPAALALALEQYGLLLRDLERYDESRTVYDEAVSLMSDARGAGHPTVAALERGVVHLMMEQGHKYEARAPAERVWRIFHDNYGPEHNATALALMNFAATLQAHGELDCAIEMVGESLEVLARQTGDDSPSTMAARATYGSYLMGAKRYSEARVHLVEVLALAKADPLDRIGDVALTSLMLSRLDAAEGHREQATAYAVFAVGYIEDKFGVDSSRLIQALEVLALRVTEQGNLDQGLMHLRRGVEIAQNSQTARRSLARLHVRAGEILGEHGRWRESVDEFLLAETAYVAAAAEAQDDTQIQATLVQLRELIVDGRSRIAADG
ncbi:MAG: protein kinase [Nannocystaceae bacterium]|nr:protein kinase [Nannocystaceae bacterium]